MLYECCKMFKCRISDTCAIRYFSADYRSPDSHLFPIYRDAVENTEKKRHSRKKEMRQKVNDALKVIAERVGINPEHFTLYVARHTYATALKRAGFAHALIQDALGHADMRTTEGYLDKFENAALDSANAAILGEVI